MLSHLSHRNLSSSSFDGYWFNSVAINLPVYVNVSVRWFLIKHSQNNSFPHSLHVSVPDINGINGPFLLKRRYIFIIFKGCCCWQHPLCIITQLVAFDTNCTLSLDFDFNFSLSHSNHAPFLKRKKFNYGKIIIIRMALFVNNERYWNFVLWKENP